MSLNLELVVEQFIAQQLCLLPNIKTIHLALSGGLDSRVLLHLAEKVCRQRQIKLVAVHVHHGLSPNADSWLQFNEKLCQFYNVALITKHINIPEKPKDGIESYARQLRYLFFTEIPCQYILLAHHANDQAETILFRFFRGSGISGITAMQEVSTLNKLPHASCKLVNPLNLWRPLIKCDREHILNYAKQHYLTWIEDESNNDEKYSRNFIRLQILPKIKEIYPNIINNLELTANNLTESEQLLSQLAVDDYMNTLESKFITLCEQQIKLNFLNLNKLLGFTLLRQKNLISYIIKNKYFLTINYTKLEQLLNNINKVNNLIITNKENFASNATSKYSCWEISNENSQQIYLWQNSLFLVNNQYLTMVNEWNKSNLASLNNFFINKLKEIKNNNLPISFVVEFFHGKLLCEVLPVNYLIIAENNHKDNLCNYANSNQISSSNKLYSYLSLDKILDNLDKLILRFYLSKDKILLNQLRPAQKLKSLWQEKQVPPWFREIFPVLCCDENVIFAVALDNDILWQADRKSRQLRLSWRFNDEFINLG